MKEFTVKSNGKEYKVKANDFRSAVKAVKAVTAKDEASQLDVIQALVTDEQAAIAAYANAIANLDGKVDPQYIEVLRNILKEENKHVENLQAIITGNVTEKNVEDSVKDAAYGYVVIRNTNEQQDFGLRFGIKLQNQIDWKNWRRVEVLTEAAAKEIERAGYTVHRY